MPGLNYVVLRVSFILELKPLSGMCLQNLSPVDSFLLRAALTRLSLISILISLIFWCVHVCMHVCVFGGICVEGAHACTWRPEMWIRCLHQSPSTLFTELKSVIEPGAHWFSESS